MPNSIGHRNAIIGSFKLFEVLQAYYFKFPAYARMTYYGKDAAICLQLTLILLRPKFPSSREVPEGRGVLHY